jgi:hypothetical protein
LWHIVYLPRTPLQPLTQRGSRGRVVKLPARYTGGEDLHCADRGAPLEGKDFALLAGELISLELFNKLKSKTKLVNISDPLMIIL